MDETEFYADLPIGTGHKFDSKEKYDRFEGQLLDIFHQFVKDHNINVTDEDSQTHGPELKGESLDEMRKEIHNAFVHAAESGHPDSLSSLNVYNLANGLQVRFYQIIRRSATRDKAVEVHLQHNMFTSVITDVCLSWSIVDNFTGEYAENVQKDDTDMAEQPIATVS